MEKENKKKKIKNLTWAGSSASGPITLSPRAAQLHARRRSTRADRRAPPGSLTRARSSPLCRLRVGPLCLVGLPRRARATDRATTADSARESRWSGQRSPRPDLQGSNPAEIFARPAIRPDHLPLSKASCKNHRIRGEGELQPPPFGPVISPRFGSGEVLDWCSLRVWKPSVTFPGAIGGRRRRNRSP